MIDFDRWQVASGAGGVSAGADERVGTLALVSAMLLFVLAAMFHPLDAATLVTGDPLYVMQMLDFGLFEFRPPLSNRWVPDALLHLAISPLGLDPSVQMIVVGALLFVVSSVAVWVVSGRLAFSIYLLVLATAGFEFVNSINHFSLPLCVLAYLLSRGTRFEPVVLFAVVFSNPLVLFPLALVFVEPLDVRRRALQVAVAMAAVAFDAIYAEFSATFVVLVVAFPVWLAGTWLVTKLGLRQWYCVGLLAALPIASAVGLLPVRYAVPVAACIPLLLFPPRKPRTISWMPVAASAAVLLLFFSSVDWRRHDQLAADYDCLVAEVARRDIGTVATDHWNSKPLYFAAKAAAADIGIVQVRFDDGSVHTHMAPYDFYGEPTRWAIRGVDSCATDANRNPIFCGQPDVAPIVSSEKLCRSFELYRYEVDLPLRPEARPDGKLAGVLRNLETYVEQMRRVIAR